MSAAFLLYAVTVVPPTARVSRMTPSGKVSVPGVIPAAPKRTASTLGWSGGPPAQASVIITGRPT